MRNVIGLRTLLFSALLLSLLLLAMPAASFGQIGISITVAPPEIPVYEQPICPTDGYLWTPGYWGYGDDGYYWVAGDWIQPPEVGFLWTPGYWGWGGNAYAFHEGYWGQNVGFYGGINYGFGYGGHGYEGGRWDGGHFSYNTSVNRVDVNVIHNTYNTRVAEGGTRVSFNGGNGGIEARASVQEEAAANERHVGPVAAQTSHVAEARANPALRASANHGNPPAVNRAAEGGKTETAARPEAANNVKAEERPAAAAKPSAHASEIAPHTATAPNTGNAKTDQKYQKQQNSLVAKQNQDHQKLAQQQEKEHQQLTKSNASEAQKQQVEQKHQQQTQQLEQKHAAQTQRVQTRQQPRPAPAAKPAEGRPH